MKHIFRIIVFTALLFAAVVMLPGTKAQAESQYKISKKKLNLVVGNTEYLSVKQKKGTSEEDDDDYYWGHSEYWETSNPKVAEVDSYSGRVKAKGPGKCTITVTRDNVKYKCKVTVQANSLTIDTIKNGSTVQNQTNTVVLYVGETINAKVNASAYSVRYFDYEIYRQNSEDYVYSAFYIDEDYDEDGLFEVEPRKAGDYDIEFSVTSSDQKTYTKILKVSVKECGLSGTDFAIAKNRSLQLPLTNAKLLSVKLDVDDTDKFVEKYGKPWDEFDPFYFEWFSDWSRVEAYMEESGQTIDEVMEEFEYDTTVTKQSVQYDLAEYNHRDFVPPSTTPTLITVGDNNMLYAGGTAGEEEMVVEYLTAYGETVKKYITVYVTDPQQPRLDSVLFVDEYSYRVDIPGSSDYSNVKITSNNTDVVACGDEDSWYGSNYVYPKDMGKAKLTVVCDGISFTLDVQVINPSVSFDWIAVKPGAKKKIEISGINKDVSYEFSADDDSIATISKNGTITGVEDGTTEVYVTFSSSGETSYNATKRIIVVVGDFAAAAVGVARSKIGTPYSQDKRMSEGYYDCSSLAWRSYHDAGIDLCNTSYAPTAAAQAEYFDKDGYRVASKSIDPSKLKPGDLIYFAGSKDNGRYKKIDHVAMFYGVSEDNSGQYLIIHAVGRGVCKESYYYRSGDVVLIARPQE